MFKFEESHSGRGFEGRGRETMMVIERGTRRDMNHRLLTEALDSYEKSERRAMWKLREPWHRARRVKRRCTIARMRQPAFTEM
jgi:hypothetical protein